MPLVPMDIWANDGLGGLSAYNGPIFFTELRMGPLTRRRIFAGMAQTPRRFNMMRMRDRIEVDVAVDRTDERD